MNLLLPSFAISALAVSLCAQGGTAVTVTTSPRGVMAGHELAFVYDGPDGVHTRKSIVRKRAGIPATLTTYAGTGSTSVPEYTNTAINTWLNAQPGVSGADVEMDALSSGNGFAPLLGYSGTSSPIPSIATINPAAAEQSWVGMYVSFKAGSIVGPFQDDEVYNSHIYGLGSLGGSEVIGYVLDGSRTNTQLVGDLYLEHSNASGDFVNGGSVPASSTMDMIAMDAAIADVVNTGGTVQPSIAQEVSKLYFSVSPQCAALWTANASLRAAVNAGQSIGASTIFVATFSNGVVEDIEVHLTHAQVAGSNAPDANLDALSVVNVNGQSASPLYCIVSFEGNAMGNQIQALFPYGTAAPQRAPMQTIYGVSLDLIFAVATGDIDAICVRDPEGATNIPMAHAVAYDDGVSATRMGLSVAREPAGFTTPGSNPPIPLACTVSGWGSGGSGAATYVFIVTNSAAWVPPGPTLPNGGWSATTSPQVYGPFWRAAGQEVITAQITHQALGGYILELQAGSTLTDMTPLADSWPVLIKL